jgi:hypothetical protein
METQLEDALYELRRTYTTKVVEEALAANERVNEEWHKQVENAIRVGLNENCARHL